MLLLRPRRRGKLSVDSDTIINHCRGIVRPGGTCPFPFTSLTQVDGNLVVRGDADLGGGSLHVSGPCNSKDDCNSEGFHSLILDGGRFDVKSVGYVAISAANTYSPNVPASEILLQSGSGTNTVGGSGGDLLHLLAMGRVVSTLINRLNYKRSRRF